MTINCSRKLIEVALPLDAINAASVREKSIRHGHPSTLHLWWARRPLAAARAVIFSQMVDDPSAHPDRFPTEKAQAQERERLFGIIKELVQWENTNDETVLEQARDEIRESWLRTCIENADHPRAAEMFDPDRLPAFHDPFAGGGALPLEAQRLGLEAHASDLNPVAVLINKAMIEIPPRFAGRAPVNPDAQAELARGGRWNGKGAQGLAEDVRYYGRWMRDEAEKRIGHLYPKIEVTAAMATERPDLQRYVGRKLTVIGWLWARTVKSPNPAFAHVDVPLASTFMLSTKKGKEAYAEPVIEGGGYRFTVKDGAPETGASEAGVPEAGIPRNGAPEAGVLKDGAFGNAGAPPAQGTKLGRGANFRCLMSDAPIPGDYIKAEGRAGRMGARLMAIVAEGDRSRVYLPPTAEQEATARKAKPAWRPEIEISGSTQYLGVKPYGMAQFDQLFTPRQLVALTTLSDLVAEAMTRVKRDALGARASRALEHDAGGTPPPFSGNDLLLRDGGTGITAYAEAVGVYLAFAVDRLAMTGNTLVRWNAVGQKAQHCFGRQAFPMVWDYAEPNFLGECQKFRVWISARTHGNTHTQAEPPRKRPAYGRRGGGAVRREAAAGRRILVRPLPSASIRYRLGVWDMDVGNDLKNQIKQQIIWCSRDVRVLKTGVAPFWPDGSASVAVRHSSPRPPARCAATTSTAPWSSPSSASKTPPSSAPRRDAGRPTQPETRLRNRQTVDIR